jgi:hypothetical protein
MPTDQQRRLAARVHANAQRRAREKLLMGVGPAFHRQLAHAECIFSPEAHAVLMRVMPMTATKIGPTETASLPGFRFITTGKPQRVFEQLQGFSSEHDFGPGILVLPGVEVVTFGAVVECVPTYPLFRLRFGEARRILSGAWRPRAGFSGAFAEDFSAGVLIDSYGEYPAEDAGPDECTYEVARWASP